MDIEAMARAAGEDAWTVWRDERGVLCVGLDGIALTEELEKFAELVAASEREACVKACADEALGLGLLPCPFCGRAETPKVITVEEFIDDEQEFGPHSDSYAVVCDASVGGKGGCGAMGGFAATYQQAIVKWNTRPNAKLRGASDSADTK